MIDLLMIIIGLGGLGALGLFLMLHKPLLEELLEEIQEWFRDRW